MAAAAAIAGLAGPAHAEGLRVPYRVADYLQWPAITAFGPTTLDGAPAAADTRRMNVFKMPKKKRSFFAECAELDALPLIELSERSDRRIFIGLSFDGFLGIHARL